VEIEQYKAPWDLTGEGIIVPFLSKDFSKEKGFLSDEDLSSFKNGLGAIMLVNYQKSNVGPYFELLYIPGNFSYKEKNVKRITKIYVSSKLSIEHGRRNWAIPKEFADFTWDNSNGISVEVKIGNETIFQLKGSYGFFPFPIHTFFYPVELLQKAENHYLSTSFKGSGIGKFFKIESLKSNSIYFPEVTEISKIIFPSFYISPFKIQFPVAKEII
jgi:hypothetical protein